MTPAGSSLAQRCLLVTRPAAQSEPWVERLRAAGLRAKALPLIEILPPADPSALQAAWRALPARRLAVFVSPNAVAAFFAARPPGADWPQQVLAASPGPGTTEILRASGVPENQIIAPAPNAAQFDSESLWQALQALPWTSAEVLVLRGESGRDWLVERLTEAGARVDCLPVYRRAPPRWQSAQQALFEAALAHPDDHLWLFSSSEAIGHLQALSTGADWSHSVAMTTHPRIAARAKALGLAQVHEVRPGFAALVACIQSPTS